MPGAAIAPSPGLRDARVQGDQPDQIELARSRHRPWSGSGRKEGHSNTGHQPPRGNPATASEFVEVDLKAEVPRVYPEDRLRASCDRRAHAATANTSNMNVVSLGSKLPIAMTSTNGSSCSGSLSACALRQMLCLPMKTGRRIEGGSGATANAEGPRPQGVEAVFVVGERSERTPGPRSAIGVIERQAEEAGVIAAADRLVALITTAAACAA